MVTEEASTWVRSAFSVRCANRRFSSANIAADASLIDSHRCAGAGLAQHRDAAGGIVAFDEIDRLGELGEAFADRRTQSFGQFGLNGIVGRELGQFVDIGNDAGDGGLVVGQEPRLGGEQIAARGTFGAADFQQARC